MLYIPETMKNAHPAMIKEICNGCGTAGWKGALVPDTMLFLSVKDACHIHDWMYSEGKTNEDKDKADRTFLNNLIRIIEAKSKSKFLKKWRLIRAREYYLAVKFCGGPAYWDGKNNPNEQIDQDSPFFEFESF